MNAPRRKGSRWKVKITRDLVLFAGGLAGVIHETLLSKAERPTLLVVFSGMLGLPLFLRRDESRTEAEGGEGDSKPPVPFRVRRYYEDDDK